jgi:siroheme synthase
VERPIQARLQERQMSITNPSDEILLPELSYGSIWLVGAGDGDPRNLSPLAVHALGTADAVIHDLGVSQKLLAFVKPPHYREAAASQQAIERAIKLAQDGWRVVHLVAGNAVERGAEGVRRYAERNILVRIVPSAGEPIDCEAPLGFLLVHRTVSLGRGDPHSSLVVLLATQQATATRGVQRPAPLGFSMSGLAG